MSLAELIQARIKSCVNQDIARLGVVEDGDLITIRGETTDFYCRCLATHAALQIVNERAIQVDRAANNKYTGNTIVPVRNQISVVPRI